MSRTLLVGWFSFDGMGATAGDVLAADVAREWLTAAGREVDTAAAGPFAGDVDLDLVDPRHYDELVFVCGPFGNGPPITALLERFAHCRLVGLDLSMLQPLEEWNPFALLYERESDRGAHADLALAAEPAPVPVVGLIEVHPQSEYGAAGRHQQVHETLVATLQSLDAAVVEIDTRLDINRTGLRSAAAVESLIARCDYVVTTRLHGMVLALKHGVPAVVIDPIAGGAKVLRQAQVLGWPVVMTPEQLTGSSLAAAIAACSTSELRTTARRCATDARASLLKLREQLLADLGG